LRWNSCNNAGPFIIIISVNKALKRLSNLSNLLSKGEPFSEKNDAK
jgi:hypothetical protein